ncbi:MAG: AraC family transcriptional regulator [Saprospiraceae bacterium]
MKPLPFKVPKSSSHSLRIQVDKQAYFYDRLHYHPEWQITLILRSEGTLFIGDGIHRFGVGDIFMIGSNLPHLFKNDALYYGENSPGAHSISLFFDEDSFGKGFFDLPELKEIKVMLGQANKGIYFSGIGDALAQNLIQGLEREKGFPLLLRFYALLALLGQEKEVHFLSTISYAKAQAESAGKRMDDVLQFIFKHYDRTITIDEAAQAANLSVPAFSRYFKLHTRKTFISYLNEVRIHAACKLLVDKEYPIGQVAFMVGFNNLSNFNRQFKRIMGLAPMAYQQLSLTR